MSSIEQLILSAERKCSEHGKRLTPKRGLVLRRLAQSETALSAYELADICNHGAQDPMPAMSVYRILEFLVKECLVHRLETANKYVACAHIACGHEHKKPQFLICNDCHAVKEIDVCLETLSAVESAAHSVGFKPQNLQLEVRGVCGICKERTLV